MSDELRRFVEEEKTLLRELLEQFRPLATECERREPTIVERTALGGLLQAFYGGIESILRAIVTEIDGGVDKTGSWHQELLAIASRATDARRAIISPETADALGRYLGFRHVVRQAYPVQLDWARMAPLARELEQVAARVFADLDAFLTPPASR